MRLKVYLELKLGGLISLKLMFCDQWRPSEHCNWVQTWFSRRGKRRINTALWGENDTPAVVDYRGDNELFPSLTPIRMNSFAVACAALSRSLLAYFPLSPCTFLPRLKLFGGIQPFPIGTERKSQASCHELRGEGKKSLTDFPLALLILYFLRRGRLRAVELGTMISLP